jgi:hypothetical protein|tara:strand:+ start:1202 stop:1456 length:255 start_codon:yes stop_codon:yes gene_type:complete
MYESYIRERDALLKAHWLKFKDAPVRRGYNRTFGVSIDSKSDLTRALTQNLRELDALCFGTTKKHIWDFNEEDNPTVPGGPVNE